MAVSNFLKSVIDDPLKKLGFTKKSNSWYLVNEEVVLVVNLQKSQYGEQHYVNLGVALKSFGADGFPKEHLCDIRFRLSSVVPKERREECDIAFDLEKGLTDQERRVVVIDFFERYGLSLLMVCQSISSLAEAYKSGKLPEWAASKRAADFLLS